MRYFHLTENNLGETVKFRPRIPKSRSSTEFEHPITQKDRYEDATIRRICVSNTIRGALKAICAGLHDTFYVYETFKPTAISRDLPLLLVPDAKETGERWLLKPTTFKLIGEVYIWDIYHSNLTYYWDWRQRKSRQKRNRKTPAVVTALTGPLQ
jgi:hypothetical protein